MKNKSKRDKNNSKKYKKNQSENKEKKKTRRGRRRKTIFFGNELYSYSFVHPFFPQNSSN